MKKLIFIMGVLIVSLFSCKKEVKEERLYTASELSQQKVNLENEIVSKMAEAERLKIEVIKNDYLINISKLQAENTQLKATSSEQFKRIKELKHKFTNSNSLEDCKALVETHEQALYDKQTEVDNLEREAQYWCELNDTTEYQLEQAWKLIYHKDSTIQRLNLNLDSTQYQNQEIKSENKVLKEQKEKNKGKPLKMGVVGTVIGLILGLLI